MEYAQPNDSKAYGQDAASQLEKARDMHRAGRLKLAASICRNILSGRPEHPQALHLSGLIAYQEGRSDQAVRMLRKAISADPSDMNVYKNLILILRELDRMDEAAACCRQSLSTPSNNVQIFLGLGDLFMGDNFYEIAAACYEKVISLMPASATAWGNLGNALQGCRRYDEAIECYRNALPMDPANAELYYNMGIAYGRKGLPDSAISNFEKALVLKADHAQARYNLGNAFKTQGRLGKAARCYQTCIDLNADDIDARHNLANVYHTQGKLDAAMAAYTETLRRKPDHLLALNNLAGVFEDLGEAHQALSILHRSIAIAPDDPAAYVRLGNLHNQRNEFEKALGAYEKALSISPDHHDALMNMGRLLKQQGRYDEGLRYLKKAVVMRPDISNAWWYYYLSLPILYDNEQEIALHRERLSDGLATLIRKTTLDTPEKCKNAMAGIGSTTNFYLAYQGQNDIQLQKRYGQFVHEVMAANYPQRAAPRSMPPLAHGGKIRVGYVSSFMRAHTVGHFLMGWLEKHDRTKFEVYGYYIGRPSDPITRAAASKCDHFHPIAGNIEAAAEQISDDQLHLLFYTDIGMYAPATQLAGLRLAPIQCIWWGHPVTTGLPTMDYFVSSDLMEPEDGDDHYSEKLVRLPNLGLVFNMPQHNESSKSRPDFGLSDSDFVYLTSQSLFKYLPQYDDLFPCIASEVKRAKFVFISHPNGVITDQFRKRIEDAFHRRNLSMDRFCVFQPRLSPDDFIRLNQLSDVLLDPISWSGGKTTLEGIHCGLPVVTCPGPFMRGRHAYAMLKMMNIGETIAEDPVSYITIACRLGNDKDFYDRIRNLIVSRRHRLYDDETCIRGLEEFYCDVVEAQLGRQEKRSHGQEKK